MKIGILTFHCANNFGAVLQCFALQKFLKEENYDVSIIDYRPSYLTETSKLFPSIKEYINNPIVSLKRTIKTIIHLRARIISIKKFNLFRKNNFSLYKFKKEEDFKEFNTIIIGSDQIWNKEITNGFDYYFWGDFKPKKTKLITYAASIGKCIFNENDKLNIAQKLQNFKTISVREIDLQKQLQLIYKGNINLVLDPTLLLKKESYAAFIQKPILNKKYLLIYEVAHNRNTERIAHSLAAQLGLSIVRIGSYSKDKSIYNRCNIGPADFINYIYFSNCIVTTSFHGTVFSIILNKPFYTIKIGNKIDERSHSLLSSLNLTDRHIDNTSTPIYKEINYDEINLRLERMRLESINYLKQSI
jgi:hypothetical protein